MSTIDRRINKCEFELRFDHSKTLQQTVSTLQDRLEEMKSAHEDFNDQLVDRLNASHSKIDNQILNLSNDFLDLAERLGENVGR